MRFRLVTSLMVLVFAAGFGGGLARATACGDGSKIVPAVMFGVAAALVAAGNTLAGGDR